MTDQEIEYGPWYAEKGISTFGSLKGSTFRPYKHFKKDSSSFGEVVCPICLSINEQCEHDWKYLWKKLIQSLTKSLRATIVSTFGRITCP